MHDAEAAMRRTRQWFAQLDGEWRIDRRIVDTAHCNASRNVVPLGGPHAERVGGTQARVVGRFVGSAHFDRIDAQTVSYREEGRLALREGGILRAQRRYVYHLIEGDIVVLFDDGPDRGKPFLSLRARSSAPVQSGSKVAEWYAVADHACGQDLYRAIYRGIDSIVAEATGIAALRIVQRIVVSGPRKHYAALTRMKRR